MSGLRQLYIEPTSDCNLHILWRDWGAALPPGYIRSYFGREASS